MNSPRAMLRDPDIVYRRRWLTLLVLCISLVVITLDNTILNVAIPTLAKPVSEGGLGASASQLQWIVDAYTLVFAGLLLTAGSLGDRFGRYRFLAFGLTVFGIGSALSASASSPTMLIVTRGLMGIGGAFIMPATLSIITNVFTEPVERGKAIGIWAGVSALGIGLGPITGGILLEHFWWGSVFIVNVPIVIAGLVLGYFLVPESRDPEHAALDPFGAVLSIAALGSLLWAIIEAPSKGWGSTPIIAGFVIGVALLVGFFAWELHTPHPMLDMHFFENPRFSAASGAITLVFLALFGTLFLLTQYLQSVLGYSTVKAGAVLIPQAAAMMISAPLSSVWVAKLGNKVVVATGLLLVTFSLVLFRTFEVNSSALHVIVVSVIMGIGMANIMAPCTDSIMGSLPRAKAGVGSAVNDTTRQMGGAIGVAVFGSLMASHFTSQVREGLGGVVSADTLHALGDNVGQAIGVAGGSPEPVSGQIVAVAKESFVTGLHLVGFVAAAVTLLAAIGVAKFLPARPRDFDDAEPVGELEAQLGVSMDLAPSRPGRRRDPEVDEAILDAALELFREDGYRGVTIEGVAARAGVGKASVYRRYPTRAELIVDAARIRLCLIHDLVDTGDLRADLLALMLPLIGRLNGPDGGVLTAFMCERFRDPELAAEWERSVVGRKREHVRALIHGAIARGELPADADVELLAELPSAVIWHHALNSLPVDQALAERIVDHVVGPPAG